MPPGAAHVRAEQVAILAGLVHERLTSDALAAMLTRLEGELGGGDTVEAANVRETRRDFDRAVKLPRELVQEIARVTSLAHNTWVEARKASDFARFAPLLEQVLDLKRQAADHIGWKTERYDALMDQYEVGARAAEVAEVFAALRQELVPLVAELQKAPRRPDLTLLQRPCPVELQKTFNRRVAEAIGFDFAAGRIDTSAHPFCTSFSQFDVRLTTRYDERYMPMSLFGILHEAGHGLYEQGFDAEQLGTPMADSVSLGIHESQSRMWENQVGRSRPFWEHFLPALQQTFTSLAGVKLDDWCFAINNVRPSLIRVEADEVTYGLHIMLRFDLERRLIDRKLAVRDVPEAWNTGMKDLLGIAPERDAEGCLQDVHWSSGIFGYFPTYQLGNLYAAQFFAAVRQALPDLDDHFRRGQFRPLLDWLRTNIHRHGRRYTPGQLLERATGRPMTAQPYVEYLKAKFRPLYGLPA
jgi:carboxypeptidase Taq